MRIVYIVIGLILGYLFFRLFKKKTSATTEIQVDEPKSVKKKEKIVNPAISFERLQLGKNTYLFEIKQSQIGRKYLKLSETWMKDGKEVNKNIIVFKEHLNEFSRILDEIKKRI